ncbi:MAG: hypothetical protein DMF68_03400 [Acidobacteria bacterium]|nr:MAG: hypothetical protein DMF68_03400 [Acidobacteriota bacterium]
MKAALRAEFYSYIHAAGMSTLLPFALKYLSQSFSSRCFHIRVTKYEPGLVKARTEFEINCRSIFLKHSGLNIDALRSRLRRMKVNEMKQKLTTILFVAVLVLLAAPLAIEQVGNLKGFAERWAKNNFLSGVVIVHASERAEANNGQRMSISVANPIQSSADEFHWNGRINQGQTIEIKGINGSIRAETSSGNETQVTAKKTGRRSDPKEVEIRVVEHSGGVTICAIYPSDSPGNPNSCESGENGSSRTHDNDVQVNFTVRVPQGVRFSGKTVNGDIETSALSSDVDAKTVNGSIKIAAGGIASAKTVNGSINASLGSANWTGTLDFKTVNGGITLDLPSNTNAQVQADTLNGEISTDFPLTTESRTDRRHLSGTIGGGGRELSLKTVNGSINLRRALSGF